MRCDYCGTPLDDPYFLAAGPEPHSTAHCREYLKAALGHANRECSRLQSDNASLRAEVTRLEKRIWPNGQ